MKKIVFISCVSRKKNYRTNAEFLYDSPLFNKTLKYAKSLNPDKIFILSAEYGLLELTDIIEPYNKTLNKMSVVEKKRWATTVLCQLTEKVDINNDLFIFLAGNNYRKYLTSHLKHYEVPMNKLPIGKQLQWLTNQLKNL
jgi:cytoplasmic iron level regulating protein YaaA (DUF328/UPF0246 family)